MFKPQFKTRFLLLFVAMVFSCADSALGSRLFIFTETEDGGVDVVGSGGGLVDRTSGTSSSDWDIQDFVTNFLKDTYTDSQTGASTVSGSFSNITTGITETIVSFAVDRDGGPSLDNDIDYDTANTLSFSFEDEFAFEVTATFLPTELPFDQLIIGRHVDLGRTQGVAGSIAEEAFGVTTVIVRNVPEPASMVLIAGMLAALGIVRRCRK